MINNKNNECGSSLVETLIAMVLASLLAIVLLNTLYSALSESNAQRSLSSLQQAERHAAQSMGLVAREAGYFVAPTLSSTSSTQESSLQSSTYFPAYTGSHATFAAGQVVAGTTSSVDIRFQSALNANTNDPSTVNCLGQSSTSATPTIYDNDYFINSTTHSLECTVNGGTAHTIIGGGNYNGIDVSNMGVMYGVSTSGSGYVNGFETASSVSANNQWNDVTSAQITIDLSMSGMTGAATSGGDVGQFLPFTFNLDFKGGNNIPIAPATTNPTQGTSTTTTTTSTTTSTPTLTGIITHGHSGVHRRHFPMGF